MSEYAIGVLTNIGLISFIALSAYLLLIAGEMSFGQQGFFGVGAYVAGVATAMYGVPLPLAALLAMAAHWQQWRKVMIGATVPATALVGWDMVRVLSATGGEFGGLIGLGIGAFVMLAGGVAAVIAAWKMER